MLRWLARTFVLTSFTVFAAGVYVEYARAAEEFRPAIAPSAGREMVYGPAVASSLEFGKEGPYINRALSIALPHDATVTYDMDRYGVAAFWTGGFLDGSGTHLTSYKGERPARPQGDVRFRELGHAGWAHDGRFDHDYDRSYPLPWVRYRGHYVHGDRVVLSYAVNGRQIFESPWSVKRGERTALVRQFHVAAGDKNLRMFVTAPDPDLITQATSGTAPFRAGKVGLAAYGDTRGLNWEVTGQREVCLRIPPAKSSLNFRVVMLPRGNEEQTSQMFQSDFARLEKDTASLDGSDVIADPTVLRRGGPARWPQRLATTGVIGKDDGPYAADTVTVPHDNPWKSWMQLSALDFFDDGRLAVSTLNGDVWIVSGIDQRLENVQWKRFASGLYEPLGLKIVKGQIHVTGRDRITRLHDFNSDDEADYYESFYAGGTPGYGYHAFAFELQTDSRGNFYFVKGGRKAWGGGDDYNHLIRVSPEGTRAEKVAGGFRHPNGMGIGPSDEILVADNEGDSIRSSRINLIRPGGFYGYASEHYKKDKIDPPLLWLPKNVDSSCGGQTWVLDQRWGPLRGTIFHVSYSKLTTFYIMPQKTKGGANAAACQLPFRFKAGLMRPRVNPRDGQVYFCGLKGWDTPAVEEGCLNRIRYTGKPAYLVKSFAVTSEGLRFHFTCELNRKTCTDPDNFNVEQWNYESKQPTPEEVFVDEVRIGSDGRSLELVLEEIVPVDQIEVSMDLEATDGTKLRETLYATVNVVPE